MAEWMAADLSEPDLLVIQIDGIQIEEDLTLLAAIGIDGDGGAVQRGGYAFPALRVARAAYSDEFERRFQSIVNAGSDDFERAGVRRWWWFSFHFGSVRSRGRSSP